MTMKKLLCLCVCVLLLCSAMPVTTYAFSENHCDVFYREIEWLWDCIYWNNGSFDASVILGASVQYFEDQYITKEQKPGTQNPDVIESDVVYTMPEEALKAAINKVFYIEDMAAFRQDIEGRHPELYSTYNATDNTYHIGVFRLSGWGSAEVYALNGYTVDEDIYTVYGYTADRAYEKPEDAIEGVDYVMVDGEPALIAAIHKCVLKFDGENIRYYSWENIDNIPDTADMITPLSPGDADGDGKVNVRDLGLLQQHLNGWDVDIHTSACDVNGDGKANVRDLGLLQQHLNGWDVELI